LTTILRPGDEGASSVLRSQLADLDLEIDKLEV